MRGFSFGGCLAHIGIQACDTHTPEPPQMGHDAVQLGSGHIEHSRLKFFWAPLEVHLEGGWQKEAKGPVPKYLCPDARYRRTAGKQNSTHGIRSPEFMRKGKRGDHEKRSSFIQLGGCVDEGNDCSTDAPLSASAAFEAREKEQRTRYPRFLLLSLPLSFFPLRLFRDVEDDDEYREPTGSCALRGEPPRVVLSCNGTEEKIFSIWLSFLVS